MSIADFSGSATIVLPPSRSPRLELVDFRQAALYFLSPAMLTNLCLDGELDVIDTRPCETRFRHFGGCFPLFFWSHIYFGAVAHGSGRPWRSGWGTLGVLLSPACWVLLFGQQRTAADSSGQQRTAAVEEWGVSEG